MIVKKTNLLMTVPAMALLISGIAIAGGKDNHQHEKEMEHHSASSMSSHHDGHGDAHRHDQWVEPPADYAVKTFGQWNDQVTAQNGKALYQQYCASCHGDSGKGDGPAGTALEHAPADLTNHFHSAPGQGDGYLFWRISEGGVVEPFRSQKSAMPPFKSVLSEQQRWEVLSYVHQEFHGGFPNEASDTRDHKQNSSHGH